MSTTLLDLPPDIVLHEIMPLLPFAARISLFDLCRATRRLEGDGYFDYWQQQIDSLSHQQTQKLFIDWGVDGRRADRLYTLTRHHIDKLDYKTILIVALRFSERISADGVNLERYTILRDLYNQRTLSPPPWPTNNSNCLWFDKDDIVTIWRDARRLLGHLRTIEQSDQQNTTTRINPLSFGITIKTDRIRWYLFERIVEMVGDPTTLYDKLRYYGIDSGLRGAITRLSLHRKSVVIGFNNGDYQVNINSNYPNKAIHSRYFWSAWSRQMTYLPPIELNQFKTLSLAEIKATDPWCYTDPNQLGDLLLERFHTQPSAEMIDTIKYIHREAIRVGRTVWAKLFMPYRKSLLLTMQTD